MKNTSRALMICVGLVCFLQGGFFGTECLATPPLVPNPRTMTGAPKSMLGIGSYLQGWAPGSLGLAITSDGKTAYVSFALDDSLLVVDLTNFTISDSIDVSAAGIQLFSGPALLSLDGKKLYVANMAVGNVMVVDTSNRQVTKVLPISSMSAVAMSLSPDGSKVYVCGNGWLYIVSTADDSYQGINVPGVLFGPIAPSRNNPNLLYTVGTLISNQVFQSSFFAFNVANQTVERSMSLPSDVIQYPVTPCRLVLNSNETVAYFGWSQSGTSDKWIGNLVAFDLSNFQVAASVAADYGVADFAVNETLGKIYVIGFWSGGGSPNNVPILEWDISAKQFVRNIPLSPSSDQRSIAVDPANSDFLYEIDGDHNILRKIQISTGSEISSMRFNEYTFAPRAIIRDGNMGYVFGSSQNIYKLDLESGQLMGMITVPVPFDRGWGFYQDKLYACTGNDILAINPSDGSIIQSCPVGLNIQPDYFTFFGDLMAGIDFYPGGMIAKQLVIFDAQTMALLETIPLPNESHGGKVIVSPDGSKLYICRGPMFGGTTVITVFNATTLEVINTIEIPPVDTRRGATGFLQGEFDEENRILYLLGFESVYKIHMDTDQLIGTLDLIDIFAAWGRNGWTPTGLAGISFSPSKDKLLIASGDAHSLYTYDIAKSSWSTNITNLRGYFITDGVASLDRRNFYTANWRSDSVTMVDLATGAVIKIIDLQSYSPAVIVPLIKANRQIDNVTINSSENLSIAVQLYPGEFAGVNVDWWVVARAGSSWYYMNNLYQWVPLEGNFHPVYQGPLFNLPETPVLNMRLGAGSYTFYFAVDYPMDGILNLDGPILVDAVNVNVQ